MKKLFLIRHCETNQFEENTEDHKKKLNDTRLWLSFLHQAIIKAIRQGDMISEILEYPMPKEINSLIMKDITLRQGLKRQINYYKNKKIIE